MAAFYKVIYVQADGGYGGMAGAGHNLAVTGTIAMLANKFFDKSQQLFLLFSRPDSGFWRKAGFNFTHGLALW
jgi:hypothetical protein